VSGLLVGVGVGPGDPELVTVKALRTLRDADAILVPVLDTGEAGRAETIVRAHLGDDPRVRRAVFALNDRGGVTPRRAAAWDAAARTAVDLLRDGADTVAFATIGDPNLYSTFTYLARTVRDLAPGTRIETVPGITAMQDLAARSGTVLAEGDEPLTLLPLAGRRPGARDLLRAALRGAGTVVAYKFGSRTAAVRADLRESGRLESAVYGARLGLDGERVAAAAELDGPAPYLSTLIAPARRTTRGGRL
jgi:precorrin-2/cobalt-factor-2 C20-methyltransferase